MIRWIEIIRLRILSQSDRIFLAQNNDSCDLIVQKRFWLRWLIRRLLAICVELKESSKVKKRACEILELIMKNLVAVNLTRNSKEATKFYFC